MIPAFITFGLIPLGGDFRNGNGGAVTMFGHRTFLQLADPGAGVLVILAMSSIAVYGVMLAGWSSGSKYPLLGSVRASAQMVSYEAALGPFRARRGPGHWRLDHQRHRRGPARTWHWNLWVTGFVPFVIFFIAGTAELNRPPFDVVEAEQELTGSFQTEYSGFRFAIFYLAEFLNAVTMAAIIVTLFLGWTQRPGAHRARLDLGFRLVPGEADHRALRLRVAAHRGTSRAL